MVIKQRKSGSDNQERICPPFRAPKAGIQAQYDLIQAIGEEVEYGKIEMVTAVVLDLIESGKLKLIESDREKK